MAREELTLASNNNNNLSYQYKMLQNQLGIGGPGINYFNKLCNQWDADHVHLKHFKLGDYDVKVENFNNKFFKIEKINFNIDTDGQVFVIWTGEEKQIQNLEELRAEINHYKQMYKEIKAFSAKLQAEKDFV